MIAVVAAFAALASPMPGCNTAACARRVAHRASVRHIARETRRLTPYRCSFGRSAIPCYIVVCESHGKWSAYNRSGAAGRYQIMPMHGRPWPVRTRRDKLAHHRIAARLWNGGRGASQWVCA